MIWLTWRQQRFETILCAAVLALVAVLLLLTGVQMASTFDRTGVGSCLGAQPPAGCFTVVNGFKNTFDQLLGLTNWFNFLPLLFGLLFGAPFVLELEGGTYRLAWTQSITRTHWVAMKLGSITLVTLLAAGIFTLLMTWWRLPFDRINGNIQPGNAFDFEGTVPLAYAVFAVMLGITAGTLLRRTIPAFGLSIAGFLAVRLSIMQFLRPHYLPPLKSLQGPRIGAIGGPGKQDWILSSGWVDRAGHVISDTTLYAICPPFKFVNKRDALQCLASHHVFSATVYQPESRFWTFQGIETALYVAASAILAGATLWWIRNRIQ